MINPEKQQVFVVIPTWNLRKVLIECLQSLLQSEGICFKTIVVDNASTDGTPEAIQMNFKKDVTVLLSEHNLGFAGAINMGVKFALDAGAEYIFILNNDTLMEPETLKNLAKLFECQDKVGIISPIIYYANPEDKIWNMGDRHLIGPPLTWHVTKQHFNQTHLYVDYVTGCAMMVRRNVFEQIGFFNEDYIMYFEDADFCFRAQAEGFKLLVTTEARLWHKVSTSSRQAIPQRIYYQNRSRVIFLNRYSPKLLFLIKEGYIWFRLFAHIGLTIMTGNFAQAKAGWQGTLAGYKFCIKNKKQPNDV